MRILDNRPHNHDCADYLRNLGYTVEDGETCANYLTLGNIHDPEPLDMGNDEKETFHGVPPEEEGLEMGL